MLTLLSKIRLQWEVSLAKSIGIPGYSSSVLFFPETRSNSAGALYLYKTASRINSASTPSRVFGSAVKDLGEYGEDEFETNELIPRSQRRLPPKRVSRSKSEYISWQRPDLLAPEGDEPKPPTKCEGDSKNVAAKVTDCNDQCDKHARSSSDSRGNKLQKQQYNQQCCTGFGNGKQKLSNHDCSVL